MSAHLRSLENTRKKQEILECLMLPPKALLLTKHNFYTNKLDPSGTALSAWFYFYLV